MQASISSLTEPSQFKGFRFPEIRMRGFTTSDNSGNPLYVGEATDIAKHVQYYSIKEGKLTLRLKDGIVFVRKSDTKLDMETTTKDVLYATDAVLNQLGITIFEKMADEAKTQTIGLLNGQRGTLPNIVYSSNPGYRWYRNSFDDEEQRPINFRAIDDYAFDRSTFKQKEDGSEFSISLKEQYNNDASVIYAIHRIFGEKCGLTEQL